ncbi:hypothetical protein GWI33_004445 [Rhynchophorus ferrugineus]|uniref:Uncharacterized protein n=1 Tax=Rhynchophorus ferrugineus TaxID=354439 RepID=A0A834MKG5_RHYFE|nr:hypothetical protein GWI33_004445 [Rhynchophorus ferrugineus]
MWDAFLNRTSESCTGVGVRQQHFGRRKLDIASVEYQSYIHKNVLSYLDHYAMQSKNGKPRKGCPSNKNKTPLVVTTKNDKNFCPIYLKIDTSTKGDSLKEKPGKSSGCECFSNQMTQKAKVPHNADKKKEQSGPELYKNLPVKCPVNINQIAKNKKAKPVNKSEKIINSNQKGKEDKVKQKTKTAKKLPVLILRKRIVPKKGESLLEKSANEKSLKDTKKVELYLISKECSLGRNFRRMKK